MGFKSLQFKLPTDYTGEDLKQVIFKNIRLKNFTYQIEKKSLDARNRNNPHWLLKVVVSSPQLKGDELVSQEPLKIPFKKRGDKVVVAGSGPAGFFAAYVLQLAGYNVVIIERGSEVGKRGKKIADFEGGGGFSEKNNYAFGEGGAGTFSDGKLTSRSKHISAERRFILTEYVKAGAPDEILYMSYPHVGTDNLKKVVVQLRKKFLEIGGEILFDTILEDIIFKGRHAAKVICNSGEIEAKHVIMATGHSAYDTYRMLIRKGVQFGTKNFAIGHRIEHPQKLINKAQWGREKLPGVKAAEYRLTASTSAGLPVYTFCMCPGGYVVPSAAYSGKSVVNGMSYFQRNNSYSNAGCVVGVHPDFLLGHTSSPIEILDWMDNLEGRFFDFSGGYKIPATKAGDYMNRKVSSGVGPGSYPLGLESAPLFDLIPEKVSLALSEGLIGFNRKLKGFDQGLLMGLESKTSSPIQVMREKNGRCIGFENLYFVGEGSGFAGGIISSAADGIKCALEICS